MKDIILVVKLMLSFFLLTFVTLFLIRLGIAAIFMLKSGHLTFDWGNSIIDSLKRGAAIGSMLGAGIWILSKMKHKTPPL
ncbi:immunity protein [Erwinia amylovora]|uniref:immunity protein n=1 Tax=Erwinia amylovora TaxID=552 RepID=UPI0014449C05|nr:immunity protein [Erwinia amylovora]